MRPEQQTWQKFLSLTIHGILFLITGTDNSGLIDLKVNKAISQNLEIKKVKTNRPNCIISTYENSSAENPVCANYDPKGNGGSGSCLD